MARNIGEKLSRDVASRERERVEEIINKRRWCRRGRGGLGGKSG